MVSLSGKCNTVLCTALRRADMANEAAPSRDSTRGAPRFSARTLSNASWKISLETSTGGEHRAFLRTGHAHVQTSDQLTPALVKEHLTTRVQQCAAALAQSSTKLSSADQIRFRAVTWPSILSTSAPTRKKRQYSVIAATQNMLHFRRDQVWYGHSVLRAMRTRLRTHTACLPIPRVVPANCSCFRCWCELQRCWPRGRTPQRAVC